MVSKSFTLEGFSYEFQLEEIFVLRGLDQNVNFTFQFLKRYKFIKDLDKIHLTFKQNHNKANIPFLLNKSTRILMTEMTAKLPKEGISVPLGQQIQLRNILQYS